MYQATKEEINNFLKDSSKFAINLYKKITSRTSEKTNIIISPFSLQAMLTLAYLGAECPTAVAIANVLNMSNTDRDTLSNNFREILEFYKLNYPMKIAHKIYIKEGSEVKIDFKNTAKNDFFTEFQNINFSHFEESTAIINNLISCKTNGNMRKIIDISMLKDDFEMIMINGVYFKGLWKEMFNKKDTKNEEFWINADLSVNIDMMSFVSEVKYGELDDICAKAIELPYSTCNPTMVIILPYQRNGLEKLEKQISENFISIPCRLKTTPVKVKLPKFRTEFTSDLTKSLRMLGAKKLFEGVSFISPDSNNSLNVSTFMHKVCIDVTEDGTEQVNEINTESTRSSNLTDEPVEFIADHPFLFYIWDRKTILFLGRYCSP